MAKVPYQEFIPGLAEIGYGAIAISVVPGYTIGGAWIENAGSLDRFSSDDIRAIREGMIERGLTLPSVIGNQSLLHEDAGANAKAIDRLKKTIDLCVELALPNEAVPTMNTGTAGHANDLPNKEGVLVDRLGELADYAQQKGVVVCIEPHVGGAINSIARAEWLVQAVNSPFCRLDFDVSHFEVQAIPMEDSVSRLAPLSGAIEIKDQLARPQGSQAAWVDGNGVGESIGPDGQALMFQFLLGGEGDFDLPKFLKMIGEHDSIAFEASVQCQQRPGYDGLAAAKQTFAWMADGWRAAGIPFDDR